MTRCMLLCLSYLNYSLASVPFWERTREKVQDLQGARYGRRWRRVPAVSGEGPSGWWHSLLARAVLMEPPLAPLQEKQRVWCCHSRAMEHWVIQALTGHSSVPSEHTALSWQPFFCPAGMGLLLGTGGDVERSPFSEECTPHHILLSISKGLLFLEW